MFHDCVNQLYFRYGLHVSLGLSLVFTCNMRQIVGKNEILNTLIPEINMSRLHHSLIVLLMIIVELHIFNLVHKSRCDGERQPGKNLKYQRFYK